jgi:hypothetical protein
MSASDTLDKKISDLKAKIADGEITLDSLIASRDLVQRILSGTENRSYQGGAGGRGLMNISVSDAEAIADLSVEFKLNVNFTKSVVEELRKRSYRDENKVSDQERKLRDLRADLVRTETEKLFVDRTSVQMPIQPPVQQPAQPSWYVWGGTTAAPYDGSSMLAPGTLVSQDRGTTWVAAETVGLAIVPPVIQPPADITPPADGNKSKSKSK